MKPACSSSAREQVFFGKYVSDVFLKSENCTLEKRDVKNKRPFFSQKILVVSASACPHQPLQENYIKYREPNEPVKLLI